MKRDGMGVCRGLQEQENRPPCAPAHGKSETVESAGTSQRSPNHQGPEERASLEKQRLAVGCADRVNVQHRVTLPRQSCRRRGAAQKCGPGKSKWQRASQGKADGRPCRGGGASRAMGRPGRTASLPRMTTKANGLLVQHHRRLFGREPHGVAWAAAGPGDAHSPAFSSVGAYHVLGERGKWVNRRTRTVQSPISLFSRPPRRLAPHSQGRFLQPAGAPGSPACKDQTRHTHTGMAVV